MHASLQSLEPNTSIREHGYVLNDLLQVITYLPCWHSWHSPPPPIPIPLHEHASPGRNLSSFSNHHCPLPARLLALHTILTQFYKEGEGSTKPPRFLSFHADVARQIFSPIERLRSALFHLPTESTRKPALRILRGHTICRPSPHFYVAVLH